MPSVGRKRKRSGKRNSSSSKRPRIIKGRVNIRVPGYKGLQKVSPSSLIPYLPAGKLRQAAKRALGGSRKKQTFKRRRRTRGKKRASRKRRR